MGWADITVEVLMMSYHLELPWKVHLENLYHIFAYLKKDQNTEMVFDPSEVILIQSVFRNKTGPIQPTDVMILRRNWSKICRSKLAAAWKWGSMWIEITLGIRWHVVLGLVLSYFFKMHQLIFCLRSISPVKRVPLEVSLLLWNMQQSMFVAFGKNWGWWELLWMNHNLCLVITNLL